MKSPKKRKSTLLSNVLAQIDPKEKERASQLMAFAVQINEAIIEKGWTKTYLASVMDKEPSEVSKWLSGTHNFTVNTLIDLQHVLEINFFLVEQPKVAEVRFVPIFVPVHTSKNSISGCVPLPSRRISTNVHLELQN